MVDFGGWATRAHHGMTRKFGPIPSEMRFPKSDTTRFIGTTGIESSAKGAFSRYSRQNLPENALEQMLALKRSLFPLST